MEGLVKVLADKSKREQIRKSVLEGESHKPSSVALAGWDSYLVTVAKKNTHLIGNISSDIAEEQKRDLFSAENFEFHFFPSYPIPNAKSSIL